MIKIFRVVVTIGVIVFVLGLATQGCSDSADPQSVDSTESNGSNMSNARDSEEIRHINPRVASYTKPTPEYTEMVENLKSAALAGKTYEAQQKARSLGPVEKSVLGWFCQTAWQLVVNSELHRLPNAKYLSNRVTIRALYELSDSPYSEEGRAPYAPHVHVAVRELERIVDFDSFDPKQDRRYKRTCYGN